MENFRVTAICVLCLILPLSILSFGQEMTLDEVLSTAKRVNPRLQSLENAVKAKQAAADQANVALNPSMGTILGNRTQFLELGQELEYPGKRPARTNAALAEAEIAKMELKLSMLEIEQEIADIFYDILWAQKNIELLQENVNVTEKFLESANYKFGQGLGSKLDVIKGEVEVARAKRLLQSAKENLLVNQYKLKIRLKMNLALPIYLKGDLMTSTIVSPAALEEKALPASLDSLLSTAYQVHPSLWIEKYKLKSAEYNVEMARLSSKPNFNLGLTGGVEDREAKVELNLSIPLAIWDTKKGAKLEALLQQKSSSYDIEDAQNLIKERVTFALQAYQTATQAVKLFEGKVFREAKEAAELAQKAYETGGFRFLDLIDAQHTYIDASSEYFNSLRSLRHAEIGLQTSIGKSILGDQE